MKYDNSSTDYHNHCHVFSYRNIYKKTTCVFQLWNTIPPFLLYYAETNHVGNLSKGQVKQVEWVECIAENTILPIRGTAVMPQQVVKIQELCMSALDVLLQLETSASITQLSVRALWSTFCARVMICWNKTVSTKLPRFKRHLQQD